MRLVLATLALMLAACAAEPDAEAQITSVDELLENVKDGIPSHSAEEQKRLNEYREVLQRKDNIPADHHWNTVDTNLTCQGIVKQGGLVICQTEPNATVEVGRSENDTYTQTAGPDGRILVGFDRDEPNAFIRVGEQRVNFEIATREYDTSRIDGLPKNMVSEYTEEELVRIRKASALKKVGFASKVEEIGFENGFIYPVTEHIKTTNFGAQRILNGDPKRPHFGVDLAAPKGTPILAPAAGIVSLASEEMYFEGSLIMIDHGQGLISYYLHNEDVMVEEGQRVEQGEQIGTVGSRGRSTGPHLCWRLKWRGRNLDPELLTEWPSNG
ncbi:M23 family metallopeptidase [Litorimonas sp. WD9-15]|uniref:M23 family metallopeptidase n=1 Tax=Litorimonas sp. WD9-15 TaxID=3418716 RepID=UPI003D047354